MIITAVIGGNSGTGSVGADITVPLFIVTFLSVPVALIAKLFRWSKRRRSRRTD
jgi:hypothetical protein